MFRPILVAGLLSCALSLAVPDVQPKEGGRSKRADGLVDTGEYEVVEGLGFYMYHDYATSWCMAQEICVEEGAQLMVINNEREAELVRTFFDRFPTTRGDPWSHNWAWVGLRERGTNNQYASVNGESLEQTGYYEWSTGYPKLSGPNDCVVTERGTGSYADDPCERHYAFICESKSEPMAGKRPKGH